MRAKTDLCHWLSPAIGLDSTTPTGLACAGDGWGSLMGSAPREFLENLYDWPGGSPKEDAPAEFYLAVGVRNRLKSALDEKKMSPNEAASAAGIASSTIYTILNGKNWPALNTIAKLERFLNTDLWGDEHR